MLCVACDLHVIVSLYSLEIFFPLFLSTEGLRAVHVKMVFFLVGFKFAVNLRLLL